LENIMDYITCAFEVKASSGDDGTIFGYGSIFGNVDSYGDTVAKGAFKKTIADAKSGAGSWPAMLLQHGDATAQGKTPIGIWTEMDEDDKGLRLAGKLAIKTARGANAYALLKMKPRPALDGLSIGYRCTAYELHGKGSPARRTIKGVDLIECSLVTFPADKFARVISVKSCVEPEPVDEAAAFKRWAREDFEALRRAHRLAHDGRR
jgi:HK97 family phage prohead protease